MKFFPNGFLIFGAAMAQIIEADNIESVVNEFNDRANTVHKLERIYSKYEDAKDSPTEQADEILKGFLKRFESDFEDSDDWLFNTFMDKDGLVAYAIVSADYHYYKIKSFLNKSSDVILKAFDVHINYLTARGNTTQVKEVKEEQENANKSLSKLKYETLHYLRREAWKQQFKLDVDDMLKNYSQDPLVHKRISAALGSKYPFRAWVVLRLPSVVKKFFCRSEISYEKVINTKDSGKVTIYVFQDKFVPNLVRPAVQNWQVYRILNNIPKKKNYFSCKDRMTTIYEESEYKCSRNEFAMFSVFKVEDDEDITKMIAANYRHYLFKKSVERTAFFFFCKQKYVVVIYK